MTTASGIGVAIVGWGTIGAVHARVVESLRGVRLVAVCRRDGRRAEGIPDRVAVEAGLDAVLDREDVDLVVLCTPSGLHASQALNVIAAGKHVVVEKPLALTVEDARAVVNAAETSQRLFSVILQRRFEPAVQHVRAAMASGALGEPILGEALLRWHRGEDYYAQAEWRGTTHMDGGALMNQGIHVVDLLRWLMGPVVQVSGSVATRVHAIQAEDTAVAALRFASGALGVVATTTATSPGQPGELNLAFERGTICMTEAGIVRWDVPELAPPSGEGGGGTSGASRPSDIGLVGHRRQWGDIVDALTAGRVPAVDADEGAAAVELVDAVYRSHRLGEVVRPPHQRDPISSSSSVDQRPHTASTD